jgi:GTPase SAR1 family protein
MKTFHSIIQSGKEFSPQKETAKANLRLSPGVYTTHYNAMTGQFWFEEFKNNHDKIIDLPSPEYQKLTNEMVNFLKPETRRKFEEKGFLYKRSALLYGAPGCGKTVLVNRVIQEVVKNGGVVLFSQDPRILPKAYEVLDDLQPETVTMVVFEEFDTIINQYGESILLNILDGEIQKQNVMYLATTNYLGKIPKRMIRPGRMSSVIEVRYPNTECRAQYFSLKMENDFKDLNKWVEQTDGLSVDELKEVVQSVYIFDQKLETVVATIKATRDYSDITESDELDEDY